MTKASCSQFKDNACYATENDWGTVFSIKLDNFNASKIIDYNITLTCNEAIGFRITRGYEAGTTTRGYWYTTFLTSTKKYKGGISSSTADSSPYHVYQAGVSTDGNVSFRFDSYRYASGKSDGPYQTKCTEFYLSGSVIYK